MPDPLAALEGAGAVAAIVGSVVVCRQWYKSELRDAWNENTQLHRDKNALLREIERLTHLAYPNGSKQ